jgi:DEAD/DEAH box helicase domain-containing protein
MSLESLISHWRTDPQTAPNFAVWRSLPAREADTRALPEDLAKSQNALTALGIMLTAIRQAWQLAAGANLVTTGTRAEPCVQPAGAHSLLENSKARALYLFPTKALAQDQLTALGKVLKDSETLALQAAIYDGDTPQGQRSSIRRKARLIISNPDMLNAGILPHHTNWSDFFQGLRFVVIDEMHTYRGVFGSHVANVLRRLKRIARFHGTELQFILSSATIGNPQELAQRLVEAKVELIERDGSARGPREFVLYNPPVVDRALGLRKSLMLESIRLAQELNAHQLQSVVFARSRRSVELMLTYLQAAGTIWRETQRHRPSRATAPAISHRSDARSSRVCATEPSRQWSPRTHLSLAST